ncbi:MAG: response regulator [Taibaiella sp.]|nr:response regulator [Taibaiella sp.]
MKTHSVGYYTYQYLHNIGIKDIYMIGEADKCIGNLYLHPHIVFLDHETHKGNGLEILEFIKRTYPEIYIVYMYGYENETIKNRAIKNGAFECIVKGENDNEKVKSIVQNITRTIE